MLSHLIKMISEEYKMSESEKLEGLEADLLKSREKASIRPDEYREKANMFRHLRPDDLNFQRAAID